MYEYLDLEQLSGCVEPVVQPALGLCGVPGAWTTPVSPEPLRTWRLIHSDQKSVSYSWLLPPLRDLAWEERVGEAGEEVCMIGWMEEDLIKKFQWFKTSSLKQPLQQFHSECSSPITEGAAHFNPHSLCHLQLDPMNPYICRKILFNIKIKSNPITRS